MLKLETVALPRFKLREPISNDYANFSTEQRVRISGKCGGFQDSLSIIMEFT